MDSIKQYEDGHVFTAWIALIGTIMAAICLLCFLAVTGFDLHQIFKPEFALTLSAKDQALFRTSMISDCFGFYLPFLVVGVYLWRKLRSSGGLLSDIALMFLVISTMLGITGAVLQASVLGLLAETYTSGNHAAQQAAGVVWATISQGSQNGLWPMEGPTIGFWAIVNGLLLRKTQSSLGLPLCIVGFGYVAFAALLFTGFPQAALLLELILLPVQVVWLSVFGLSLLAK
ncbi:DUF4386 family protein [Acinetobacter colistiniresistens]|uniref:DUF4386 domain-containing protein n=1 Tax=Acinetobacter colistiniresistens TaxID=280145 RepID=A0A558EU20_9GAMM|nr:DUF4386 family protein [Acinetobacter colistiniresistens]TVT76790.1 DUF4386 domain-containing protein [Acinetobacter colistiniresistens]